MDIKMTIPGENELEFVKAYKALCEKHKLVIATGIPVGIKSDEDFSCSFFYDQDGGILKDQMTDIKRRFTIIDRDHEI